MTENFEEEIDEEIILMHIRLMGDELYEDFIK